jgi:beta-glucosidase
MYVEHLESKVPRPIKALKGFLRVSLKPGEKRTIRMPLEAKAIGYWDQQAHAWRVEPGSVRVSIGSSSTLTRLSKVIKVD